MRNMLVIHAAYMLFSALLMPVLSVVTSATDALTSHGA